MEATLATAAEPVATTALPDPAPTPQVVEVRPALLVETTPVAAVEPINVAAQPVTLEQPTASPRPAAPAITPDVPNLPQASNVTLGGGVVGVGTGTLGVYNGVVQGDAVATSLGLADTASGGIAIAEYVQSARGIVTESTRLGTASKIAGNAAIPLAVLATAYEVYKEEGTGADDKMQFKTARALAGGAAIGTGVAATAGMVTLMGGAAAVAAAPVAVGVAVVAVPVAAVVAVGYTANEAIEVAKVYAAEDKRFAASQDNRNIEGSNYLMFDGNGDQNRAKRAEFIQRGAKFKSEPPDSFVFDLNDAQTRSIVRKELTNLRDAQTAIINSYTVNPRYIPFAGDWAHRYNQARTNEQGLNSALTELDNYQANRQAMLQKREAEERVQKAQQAAVASDAPRINAAIERIDRNKDGKVELADLDRNNDGKVDLRDYVDKNNEFSRESIAEIKKDIAALQVLSERYPELAPMRDGLIQLADNGERTLAAYQQEVGGRMAATTEPSADTRNPALALQSSLKQTNALEAAAALRQLADSQQAAGMTEAAGINTKAAEILASANGSATLEALLNTDVGNGKTVRTMLDSQNPQVQALAVNYVCNACTQHPKAAENLEALRNSAELETRLGGSLSMNNTPAMLRGGQNTNETVANNLPAQTTATTAISI